MYGSVPNHVHGQNLTFKLFNMKLPLAHGTIKLLVILSINKPILDNGTCSLSRISTLTPFVTKQWYGYTMSRDISRGNFFGTHLVNHICYLDLSLFWTVTVQNRFLSIRGNSKIFHYKKSCNTYSSYFVNNNKYRFCTDPRLNKMILLYL